MAEEQAAAGEMMLIFWLGRDCGRLERIDVAEPGRPDRDHCLGPLRI
jgi:hypothetical protein